MESVRGNYKTKEGKKGKAKNLTVDSFLGEKEIERLRTLEDGELSELMEFKDGSKGKMMRSGNTLDIYKCKDVLEIPNEVFGEKLTDAKKQSLANGNTILICKDDSNLYLTVDSETNSIIVRGDDEIGLSNPMIMGANESFGYEGCTLSERDRVLMANGCKTEQKLFCGDTGFFLSELALTEDRRGFMFTNVVTLSEKEAKAYLKNMENQQNMNRSEKAPCVEKAIEERDLTQKTVDVERDKVMSGKEAEQNFTSERVVEQSVMGEDKVKKESFKEEVKTDV